MKLLKLLLTIASIFGLCVPIFAYDFESGGIYYNILSESDKTVSVTYKTSNYNSYKGQVEIPNKVSNNGKEYKVAEIGNNAFQDCPDLRSVIMPNSVTYVGNKAFYNSGIISVTIGTNVISVGDQAFFECPQLYKVIMLPNSVPAGLSKAMKALGGRVTYVANSNFSDDCLGTKNIYKFLSSLFVVDGVRYVPVSPSDRTCDVIDYDYNRTTSTLTVTDKVLNQGIELNVLDIKEYSFYNVEPLTEINISNTGIVGDYAFCGCNNLLTVNMSANVTSIGRSCFQNASKLVSVILPSTLTFLSSYVFDGCTSLPTINLPDGITKIGNHCFSGCSILPKIELPSNLEGLGDYALAGTNISDITIPSKTNTIGNGVFNECTTLSKVVFADGNGTLQLGYSRRDLGLFYDCPLKKVYIGRHLSYSTGSSSGYSPFYSKTDLANITITDAETDIYEYEFAGCSSLKEIIIPASVKKIGDYAFRGCSSLSKLVFSESNNELSLGCNGNNGLFKDCPLTELFIGRDLKYNKGSDYGYSPFYRSGTLKKVTISDLSKFVFANEFYGCTALTEVNIGEGVTEIGDYAFSGCISIESFTFGGGMKKIGAEAFSDCTAMTSLVAKTTIPPVCGSQALDDINKWVCKLYIPEDAIDEYKEASQWKDFFFFEKLYIIDRLLCLQMSNTSLSVRFSDLPKITFNDGQLLLYYNGDSNRWAFDDFDMWYFGCTYTIDPSGINEVLADGSDISISFNDNVIKVLADESVCVIICDVTRNTLAAGRGSVDIDMIGYPKGVYIVRAGDKSVKFLKQ